MTLGALCATALAAIGPGAVIEAFGDEQPTAIDTSKLVRFDDSLYLVQQDDWVATEPTAQARVKKIEYGRTSYVDIVTTATGTYSTDAMFSNNVQYPGITVTELARFSSWHHGYWGYVPFVRGDSVIHMRTGKNYVVTNGRDACVHTRNYTVC